MLLVGIDTETTGISNARIIEFGAMAYDTNENAIVSAISVLIRAGIQIPQEVTKLTGITTEMTERYGIEPDALPSLLKTFLDGCDGIVAHNGMDYDKALIEKLVPSAANKLWIDTMLDIDYPPHIKHRSLVALAGEHGFLNMYPHRALFDVATMFRILSLYDINKVIAIASTPVVWVRADVSYDDREYAKKRGYIWDGTYKYWVKQMRAARIEEERAIAGFPVIELPGIYQGPNR